MVHPDDMVPIPGYPQLPQQLGRVRRIETRPPAATTVWPVRFDMLRGDRSWDRAVPWSIYLDKTASGADNVADTAGAIARIEWGVGGARHLVYCDWRQGQRLNLCAASLDVDLYLLNPADWGFAGGMAGWPVTFRASATPHDVPGPSFPPTLTVAVPSVTTLGNSQMVTIPPFARRLLIRGIPDNFILPQWQIYFFQGTPLALGASIHRSHLSTTSNRNYSEIDGWIEIPADANLCRLYNASAEDFDTPRFVFELAL